MTGVLTRHEIAGSATSWWVWDGRTFLVEVIGTFFLMFTVATSVLSGNAYTPLAAGAVLMVNGDYPLHGGGTLTLNRNVSDFHTEMEQLAFEPNNRVPGTGLSPDKMLLGMLLGRGFPYADAHHARLGVNYKQIQVNAPRVAVHSYSKDGAMRVVNVADPVYAPNSKGGPQADPSTTAEALWHADGDMVRAAYGLRRDDGDWGQAGTLVREVLDDAARDRLVSNVIGQPARRPHRACVRARFPVLKEGGPDPRRADRETRTRRTVLSGDRTD
jgi:catalase